MRRRIAGVVALGFCAAAVGPGHAAAPEGSQAYKACMKNADAVDSAMAACSQDEFDREDKVLNQAYAARLKLSSPKMKAAVQKAQKLWLAARDPTCDAESLVYEGGTLENLTYIECQLRLTVERTKWLKALGEAQ